MRDKKRTELVATKVSGEAWLRLNNICKRLGLTPYALLQETVDTLILYMDEGHQLSPDMQQVIDCFERFDGWGSLCRLTDVGVAWHVRDALYFLHDDRPNGMAGVVGCWNKGGFLGTADYTFNKAAIFDMTLRRLFPDLARSLGMLAMQAGTSGPVETIRWCIQQLEEDPDKAAIREMFADCGRTDYGKPNELIKFVRHNKKNIETVGNNKAKPVQLDLFGENTEGHEQE